MPIRIVVVPHPAAQLNVLRKSHPIGVLLHDVADLDLWIVVPLVGVHLDVALRALLAGVVGLAAGGGVVAALLEPVVHPELLLDEGLPGVVLVVVAAGDSGPDSRPDGRARRVADGRAGMGVGEGHAHGRDAVEIGSEGLLVALGSVLVNIAYPVVKVVDGDHQDVGLIGEGRCDPGKDGNEEKQERCGRHGRSYDE